MRKHYMAFAVLFSFPALATADEADDVKACADAFQDIAGEAINSLTASWEPHIFSPNRVEFPDVSVICDISLGGVVNLSQGSTIFIQDGWPIGRQTLFSDLKLKIEGEKERLRRKIKELDEVENRVDEQLRIFSSNPEETISVANSSILAILEIERTASDENSERQQSELTLQLQSCTDNQETTLSELSKCQVKINEIQAAARREEEYREAYARFVEVATQGSLAQAGSIWSQTLKHADLSQGQREELENLVLEIVRRVPAGEVRVNRDGYDLLSQINPENQKYQKKLKEYTAAIVQEAQNLEKRICRSLVIFLGSAARPESITVEKADGFPNPIGWKSVYIVKYKRPSDGKMWRYACGIDGGKINWSMIESDGTPGRRWSYEQPDPHVTYELDGSSVTFFEHYSGGTSQRRLPL